MFELKVELVLALLVLVEVQKTTGIYPKDSGTQVVNNGSFKKVSKIEGENYVAFMRHVVVPDVIDDIPEYELVVEYPNGNIVNFGNELAPVNVMQRPTVIWYADSSSYYTLVMVDPDVPSRIKPIARTFRHWLVGNIPGNNVEAGLTISEYVGLGTPRGTNFHRYVFLVYKQPSLLDFDEPYSSETEGKLRAMFSVKDFADKYSMGKPIFGNFFRAEYDESTHLIQAQLNTIVVEICPLDS